MLTAHALATTRCTVTLYFFPHATTLAYLFYQKFVQLSVSGQTSTPDDEEVYSATDGDVSAILAASDAAQKATKLRYGLSIASPRPRIR